MIPDVWYEECRAYVASMSRRRRMHVASMSRIRRAGQTKTAALRTRLPFADFDRLGC
jgi:hypothetical protein